MKIDFVLQFAAYLGNLGGPSSVLWDRENDMVYLLCRLVAAGSRFSISLAFHTPCLPVSLCSMTKVKTDGQ